MEINIARDGIRNTDEVSALIYFGRYEVKNWTELFYAAVKTLYIEYPDAINSLVSKDSTRTLYLRTTTIEMKQPVRISTILYLEADRTPEQIVIALREIFKRAGVVNINMSIEIKRKTNAPEVAVKKSVKKILPTSTESVPKQISILEVPTFMKNSSNAIRKLSVREEYIEQMKNLAKYYPQELKNEAGKFLNNRRVTLAETGYRYFIEEIEIGAGLSIEINFTDEALRENIEHYRKIFN